ncbi:hypothetical protein BOTBODRAFT_171322 [Botryobasidium botryosum FD-172 SS1]|uniref:Uncharacterized protein n=1 Tax=Botryobasidium botryosum (strain FD-172 SS1) TaxID=930990 RepID=A0A067MUV3_BOTB1|nr:hypothetical protein BOTBODRAFT_171322 [Botryobasidium botryosum FD-172 SS1]
MPASNAQTSTSRATRSRASTPRPAPLRSQRLPPGELEEEEQEEALRLQQAANEELEERFEAANRELAKYKLKKRKRTAIGPSAATDVYELALAAKKFTVTEEPWVSEDFFAKDIHQEPDDESLRRLMMVLPDAFSDPKVRGNILYGRVFTQGMQCQRSTTAHRIRYVVGATIFKCDPTDITQAKKRRSTPRWDQLLGLDPASKAYDPLPPVLYADDSGAGTDEDAEAARLFRSSYITRTLSCILNGPSSITREGKVNTPRVCAKIWGVEELTPGAIAFAAIMVRWVLSPDDIFEPIGRLSGIHYHDDFLAYRDMITDALRKKKKPIHHVLYTHNKAVFPDMFTPSRSKKADDRLAAARKLYDDASEDEDYTYDG